MHDANACNFSRNFTGGLIEMYRSGIKALLHRNRVFILFLLLLFVIRGAIADWNPVAYTVEPQPVPAYERQYPLWKALYEETKDIAHALGGES